MRQALAEEAEAMLGELSPIGWSGIDRLLETSAKALGRKVRRLPRPPRPLDGFTFALTVPHWANELSGGKLSRKQLRHLQQLQAHVLVFFLVYDPLLDGGARGPTNPAEMLPLLYELQAGLSALFGPGDPFWLQYRKLVRQQVDSARWEVAGRRRPAPPFDATLIRALGLKLSLLRWPSFAVARLAGRPALSLPLDRLFARFYGVLQLLDDVTDADADAAKGQINAVVAARSELPARVSPEMRNAIGVARVCGAAREGLARVQREARGLGAPAGRFARACDYLADRCREAEQEAAGLASRLAARELCDRVVAAIG